MAYSEKVVDHYNNPRNVGSLPKEDPNVGTGLVGAQWLMRTLSDNGQVDLAYKIATQKTYPGWGYSSQGAPPPFGNYGTATPPIRP